MTPPRPTPEGTLRREFTPERRALLIAEIAEELDMMGPLTDATDAAHVAVDICAKHMASPRVAPEGGARYETDLAHLATLGPNWDSYGSVPITPAALAAVRAFMKRVQVCPRSNGGLQLEFDAVSGREGMDLAFEPDGSIYIEEPESESEKALRLQALADEYARFNPAAEIVILHNFVGWLVARATPGEEG